MQVTLEELQAIEAELVATNVDLKAELENMVSEFTHILRICALFL